KVVFSLKLKQILYHCLATTNDPNAEVFPTAKEKRSKGNLNYEEC
ncbi:hypothetical protein NPIL_11551, partial [Nephila pilipes]